MSIALGTRRMVGWCLLLLAVLLAVGLITSDQFAGMFASLMSLVGLA